MSRLIEPLKAIYRLDRVQKTLEPIKINNRIRNEMKHKPGPPVLVHTMGKVGSTSVYRTLKACLNRPVFHTHILSHDSLDHGRKFFRDKGLDIPYNHRFSRILLRHLKGKSPIIVTLVRDPIAVRISSVFEVSRIYDSLKDTSGSDEVVFDAVMNEILQLVNDLPHEEDSFILSWFDKEVKSVFGIDVFAQPFDAPNGYMVINGQDARLLLFRLEDLNRSFENGVREMFGSQPDCQLVRSNETSQKNYADTYRQVLEKIHLAPDVCRAIYDTPLGRHFYADMAGELVQKWSNSR